MAPSIDQTIAHPSMSQDVEVDFLLPNGIIININCHRNETLETIKSQVWHKAANYHLYSILKDIKSYTFVSVVQDGEREEFYDENRRLCDLRMFRPVLKLVEDNCDKTEKIISSKISQCLGLICRFLTQLRPSSSQLLSSGLQLAPHFLAKDHRLSRSLFSRC
jgi:phosphatidylinositol-4,5-bisphosphate 3-kinase